MASETPSITTLKIVLVGAPHVGKSSLLRCYSAGNEEALFVQVQDLSLCTLRLAVEDHPLQVSFWDVTGRGRDYRMPDYHFQNAQSVALVYDATMPATFFDILHWSQYIQSLVPLVPALVIGNKIDLGAVVPAEEARGWAESKHMAYVQTSARTHQGVDETLSLLLWLGLGQLRHRAALSCSARIPETGHPLPGRERVPYAEAKPKQ